MIWVPVVYGTGYRHGSLSQRLDKNPGHQIMSTSPKVFSRCEAEEKSTLILNPKP